MAIPAPNTSWTSWAQNLSTTIPKVLDPEVDADNVELKENADRYSTLTKYKNSPLWWKILKAFTDATPISTGITAGFITAEFSKQINGTGSPLSGALAGASAFGLVAAVTYCKNHVFEAQKELVFIAKTFTQCVAISALCKIIPNSIETEAVPLIKTAAKASRAILEHVPFISRFTSSIADIIHISIPLTTSLADLVTGIFNNTFPWQVEAGPIKLATAVGLSFVGLHIMNNMTKDIKKNSSINPTLQAGESIIKSVETQVNNILKLSPLLLTCFFNNQFDAELGNPAKILPGTALGLTAIVLAGSHFVYNYKYPLVKPDRKATEFEAKADEVTKAAAAKAKELIAAEATKKLKADKAAKELIAAEAVETNTTRAKEGAAAAAANAQAHLTHLKTISLAIKTLRREALRLHNDVTDLNNSLRDAKKLELDVEIDHAKYRATHIDSQADVAEEQATIAFNNATKANTPAALAEYRQAKASSRTASHLSEEANIILNNILRDNEKLPF